MLEKFQFLLYIFVFLLSLIVILSFILTKEKKTILELRKEQSLNKKSTVLHKINDMIDAKVKQSKKYRIETLCLQAGLKLKYSQFITIKYVLIIVLFLGSLFCLRNIIMAVTSIVIGSILPLQIVKFLKNRRMDLIDDQMCSFLNLLTERYKAIKDLPLAIKGTLDDFEGKYPIYTEINIVISDLQTNSTAIEALMGMARRTGNKYLKRFCDFYSITKDIGTGEDGLNIVAQAYLQYKESRDRRLKQKKQIQAPVKDSYLMLSLIPVVVIFQATTSKGYTDFMLGTKMGQIGTTVILLVIVFSLWFINVKIGAPIEETKEKE